MDPATAAMIARAAKTVPWRKIITLLVVCGLTGALFMAQLLGGLVAGSQQQTATTGCVQVNPAVAVGDLNSSQVAFAAVIVATGQRLAVPARGWVVAIATAMQESKLDPTLTPEQSDRDSAGGFQQRAAWGPLPDRLDPATSTTMFYTGGQGGQPGLLDISGWQTMSVAAAAQAVQRSAFPDAYAQWEQLATQLVTQLTTGGTPTAAGPAGLEQAMLTCSDQAVPAGWTPLAGATAGERAVNAAAHWIGTPYAWGGGTRNGPSQGFAQGAGTVGFDCSGLVMYSWWQGGQVPLPHSAAGIAATTYPVTRAQLQAGDILSFATEAGSAVTHDGLYDGRGGMIHSPHTGVVIEYVPNVLGNPYWSTHLIAATRPATPGAAQ